MITMLVMCFSMRHLWRIKTEMYRDLRVFIRMSLSATTKLLARASYNF